MSNSSLVSYKKISPNKGNWNGYQNVAKRVYPLERISIHCVVGQVTVESLGNMFAQPSFGASSNYGIGYDGKKALYVNESDRSWCTSSYDNDNRAITIEVASDTTHPYAVTPKAYNSLIELCVDICKRNGKKKLLWISDKTKALSYKVKSDELILTPHRWFANKACPGEYLFSRYGAIAETVTKKLNAGEPKQSTAKTFKVQVKVKDLYIRGGAGFNTSFNGFIEPGVYTITETKTANGYTWGKLKSGAGWIALEYTIRL